MDTSHLNLSFARRRTVVAVECALAVGLIVCAAFIVQAQRADAIESASASYSKAVATYAHDAGLARANVDAADKAVAAATATLKSSAGHVLSESSRAALAKAVTDASSRADAARAEVTNGSPAATGLTPDTGFFAAGSGFRARAAQLAEFKFTAAEELPAVAPKLAAAEKSVGVATVAWHKEQVRLAAVAAAKKAAAARAAAAHAAAVAAYARQHQTAVSYSAPRSSGTVEHVGGRTVIVSGWTWKDKYGNVIPGKTGGPAINVSFGN